jgi:hypothetical protein
MTTAKSNVLDSLALYGLLRLIKCGHVLLDPSTSPQHLVLRLSNPTSQLRFNAGILLKQVNQPCPPNNLLFGPS